MEKLPLQLTVVKCLHNSCSSMSEQRRYEKLHLVTTESADLRHLKTYGVSNMRYLGVSSDSSSVEALMFTIFNCSAVFTL